MISALQSEWLKYRRTFVPWLVVLAPLGLSLFSWLPHLLGNWGATWYHKLVIIGNWWPVLWVPFGSALLAALAAWTDTRPGTWRALRTRPLAPATLYAAKLLVLAGQALLSTLVLLAATLIMGKLALWQEPVPWAPLLWALLLPWVASLPVLALQLWVATAGGFGASFALGIIGFLAGIWGAEQAAWVYVPWAWSIRSTIPIIGAHANGLPLEPGSPLWDRGVMLPAVLLGLGAGLLIGLASAAWFARREVR